MKKYASKGLADIAGTTGSMLLFMLFAVCMLIIVSTAASVYGRIKSGFEREFSSSASLRYVSNKIRNADSTELFSDGSGIAVTNGGILCIIYCGENGIYEKNVAAGADFTAEGGNCIFPDEAFSVGEDGELYRITVTEGAESSSVYVRKG